MIPEPHPPSLWVALRLALRAFAGESWLVAVGLGVSIVRRVLSLPAWVVFWVLGAQGAFLGARAHPLDPFAPIAGLVGALAAPRTIALVGGLWLAGLLLGAALRVAWLAGALPVLGGAMAGLPAGPPAFASGVAFRLPRVLGAALLGLVLDVTGAGWALAIALAAGRLTTAVAGSGTPALAAVVAFLLVLAVAVPVALTALADAAIARAAIRDEPPGAAFAAATRRFLARPGTFLLATLLFGAAGFAGASGAAAVRQVATGFLQAAGPALLLGPGLMLSLLALAVAAAVDVAWWGTVAALACAGEPPTTS